jgi:predicted nucleic acid-binding protein
MKSTSVLASGTSFLLDTNVISEPTKGRKNQKVIDYVDSLDRSSVYISVVTLGEIQKGIANSKNLVHKTRLKNWLGNLRKKYAGHILPLDEDTMLRWGDLVGAPGQRSLPVLDSLLAATCQSYGLTLVTRNTVDFEGIEGLRVINPWNYGLNSLSSKMNC